ncbi:MAG: N-acetylmuramoyl-L-alanine amidase, partial [Muribaculaceae bacterium]|nr:N-acetylmuramoyl-L-alanine amidase [Muribaculaceae bacterium]
MKTNNCYMRLVAILLASMLISPIGNAGERNIAPRVFLNPGHGGLDSNDRPTPFYCVGLGDSVTYFESISNLTTSNELTRILEEKGYDVRVSRVNNTSADDLDLFEIVSLAANSGADMFLSIHSNATGVAKKVNFPLALYRGFNGDACVELSDTIASMMMRRLGANEATVWTHTPRKSGDWSFYHNWGYRVGLGVLRYNKLPGMLSEGSFFDYIAERCRKMNADYCRLESWNYSLSIDDYFGRTGDY